jgi:acetyl-CoA C-acetyltransferase
MQAFPYTRAHCSTWNVDQAAALLLCSAEKAEAMGIDRARWMFPLASAEANHMLAVSARADLIRSPGAEAAARAVLEDSGLTTAEIDLVELYSCFPVAVDTFADAAGIDPNRTLTVTGGMPFAGGPYNNYFFQATACAAQLLREGAGRHALLSCVSGIMTKQAFALWSTEPPASGFTRRDVTAEAAAACAERPVTLDFTGSGQIAGYTVVYDRGVPPKAIALIDTDLGTRALVTSQTPDLVAAMQQDEWVGRRIHIENGQIAV